MVLLATEYLIIQVMWRKLGRGLHTGNPSRFQAAKRYQNDIRYIFNKDICEFAYILVWSITMKARPFSTRTCTVVVNTYLHFQSNVIMD